MSEAVAGSVVPVVVAQMGTGMDEVAIQTWLVRPGDAVAAGQPLAVVETDKITIEVEAPVAGVVRRLLLAEGAETVVGTTIAEIEAR